jgi:hypothetical protein
VVKLNKESLLLLLLHHLHISPVRITIFLIS